MSLKTMHLSTKDVIVTVDINYREDKTVEELEELYDEIETKIKEFIPTTEASFEAENKDG